VDGDIMVVNLGSLDDVTLNKIDKNEFHRARDSIWDRFVQGGVIIYITSYRQEEALRFHAGRVPQFYKLVGHDKEKGNRPKYSDIHYPIYFLSPIDIVNIKVAPGSRVVFPTDHQFSSYLKLVKGFSFYLSLLNSGRMELFLGRNLVTEQLQVVSDRKFEIRDGGGNLLGGRFEIRPVCKGSIVLLPPIGKSQIREGIRRIIASCRFTPKERIPNWVTKVTLSGTNKLDRELKVLSNKKKAVEQQIDSVNSKLHTLRRYYRLLYTSDQLLEAVVHDALKLLGLTNLRNARGKEYEDWIFTFKSLHYSKLGVIEVKGRKHMVQKVDLAQCEGWVTDYSQKGKHAKGILILNQFNDRLFPQSRNLRVTMENKLEDYARRREICVLPSCVLFDTINEVLAGKKRSREQIEKSLLQTNGTLTAL